MALDFRQIQIATEVNPTIENSSVYFCLSQARLDTEPLQGITTDEPKGGPRADPDQRFTSSVVGVGRSVVNSLYFSMI